jgi:hypothetical protein
LLPEWKLGIGWAEWLSIRTLGDPRLKAEFSEVANV